MRLWVSGRSLISSCVCRISSSIVYAGWISSRDEPATHWLAEFLRQRAGSIFLIPDSETILQWSVNCNVRYRRPVFKILTPSVPLAARFEETVGCLTLLPLLLSNPCPFCCSGSPSLTLVLFDLVFSPLILFFSQLQEALHGFSGCALQRSRLK